LGIPCHHRHVVTLIVTVSGIGAGSAGSNQGNAAK
jgi:hypothetical protein